MAAKNVRKRQKYSAPDLSQIPDIVWPEGNEFQAIDAWVPNYGRACEVCSKTPCVSGLYQGKVVYDGTMCGVCTWGEAACLDPAAW